MLATKARVTLVAITGIRAWTVSPRRDFSYSEFEHLPINIFISQDNGARWLFSGYAS